MVSVPGSSQPPALVPPLVEPKPEARHCWRHRSPTPGSEGEPVYLITWAHSPNAPFDKWSWYAQIVVMNGPANWNVEWVTSEMLSLDRYATGDPPPGPRRKS